MNFHPLGMKSILHVDSNDANVRAQGRKVDLVLVVGTCLHSICLSYRILADDFEYQVSALVAVVSRIQETLVCGVHFKPAVGVSIRFVTDTVGLPAIGCVHDGPCYRDTLLMNDKTLRVIHVTPQAVVALAAWRRLDRRSWGSDGRWRNADGVREDPTNHILLCIDVIVAVVFRCLRQG